LVTLSISNLITGLQTNWDVQAMRVSTVVDIASAVTGGIAGSCIGALGGNQLIQVVLAGVISGATANGLKAAYYGGNVGSAMLTDAA
jgi:hypothetical protein